MKLPTLHSYTIMVAIVLFNELFSIVAWSLTTTTTKIAFRPMAAPRFDTFAETLVGTAWISHDDNDNVNDITTTTTCVSVEEVMRSCGGAVQGFHEIIHHVLIQEEEEEDTTPTTTTTTTHYMNRANDEFLFLDNGSYTCRIDSKEQNSTTTTTLTNLPLPSTGKKRRRVLVKSTTTDDTQAWLLRLNGAASPPDETDALPSLIDFRATTSNKNHAPTTIHWTHHTRCRMPSASMPWMAQRLTWEQCYCNQQDEPTSSSDDPTTNNNEEPINEDESKPWSGEIRLSIGSMDDTMSILPESVFVQQSASSSHVSYVMIQCLTTQQVLCVAHQYDDHAEEHNKLCSVVWSEGKAVCVVDSAS